MGNQEYALGSSILFDKVKAMFKDKSPQTRSGSCPADLPKWLYRGSWRQCRKGMTCTMAWSWTSLNQFSRWILTRLAMTEKIGSYCKFMQYLYCGSGTAFWRGRRCLHHLIMACTVTNTILYKPEGPGNCRFAWKFLKIVMSDRCKAST